MSVKMRVGIQAGLDQRMSPKMLCFADGVVVEASTLVGKTFKVISLLGKHNLLLEETTTTKDNNEEPSANHREPVV